MRIDWIEFKQWKDYQVAPVKELGNLYLLIKFLMNEYQVVSLDEIFSILQSDSIGEGLLNKNSINTPNDIVKFMKNKN